jgi:hypothetical protein
MANIQLSHELLSEMQEIVTRHHEGADPGVVMQYMAAVMGYMLASQSQFEIEQQKQYLENLCDFARSVHSDVSAQYQQAKAEQPAPAAESAYGVWEPNK